MKKIVGMCLSILCYSQALRADMFHYNNLIIGDRAVGMGGAYSGISDDASGIFYNPAGIAFALSNDVSGSANAFYTRKVTYKQTIGDKDFEERSNGTTPSFFGFLQKLDHILEGLAFAGGMYTTDAELKEQNDLYKNIVLGTLSPCAVKDADGNATGATNARSDVTLLRFHRAVNQRATTTHYGAALGYRVTNQIALGLGMNIIQTDELVQEYQDIKTKLDQCRQNGDVAKMTEQKDQNIRQHFTNLGVQPVLAVQISFMEKFSAGLTIKPAFPIKQSFKQSTEIRSLSLDDSFQSKVETGQQTPINTPTIASQFTQEIEEDSPLGESMPMTIKAGIGFFHSARFLAAMDVTHHTAADGKSIPGIGSLYQRDSVTNIAIGMEYYLLPSVPLRLGFFTNKDTRAEIDENKAGQRDHIDYNGESVFLAWVQPNSQIGAGLILQQGKGEAQKVGGIKAIQEVEATSTTIAFSATHSF